jgi:hypothetical protein
VDTGDHTAPGPDQTGTGQGPGEARRRVTVAEAAEILGITAEAVRTRIKRGRLDSIKEPPDRTGTVFVLLPTDLTGPNTDPAMKGQDQTTDQTHPQPLLEAKDETIEELRDRVASLERQLDARQEEIRRRDILLANLVERVPQLEAPSEPRESPATSDPTRTPPDTSGGAHGATEHREGQESQVGGEPRSIWRRIFGG